MIGESWLDGGGGGIGGLFLIGEGLCIQRYTPRDSSRILKIFIWMARRHGCPILMLPSGAVKHGCSYNSPLIYG